MSNELYHHGIKGMKWGVRRYQNKDGTLTSAGRKRAASIVSDNPSPAWVKDYARRRGINGNSDSSKLKDKLDENTRSLTSSDKKKIVAATATTATVAAAAYYVHKHPEAIGKVMSQFKGMKVSDLSQKAVDAGKSYVKQSVEGVKEGIKESMKEAPKKATKAVITGVVLNQTKKALDSAVGKEESAKIFQANDNKKIGKFWKVSDEDKDDE